MQNNCAQVGEVKGAKKKVGREIERGVKGAWVCKLDH